MLLQHLIFLSEVFTFSIISGLHSYQTVEFFQQEDENSACERDFDKTVYMCFNGLYFFKKDVRLHKQKVERMILAKILDQYYCRQYTSSLQCIHDMLATCITEHTISTVQHYLSQFWALQYNSFCDINQKSTSKLYLSLDLDKHTNTSRTVTTDSKESMD